MSNQTIFERLGIYYFPRPDYPVITTIGGSVSKSATTLTFSNPLLDRSGAVVTEAIIIGIKIDTGYVENIYIPANGLDSTGTIASGVTRGLYPSGYDITASKPTGSSDFAVVIPDGSIVGSPTTTYQFELICQALLGDMAMGLKYGERNTYSGTNAIHNTRVFADATARDAAITAPSNGDECYLTSTGKFMDYTAGAWVNRESGGTFSNASTTVAGKVEEATAAQSTTPVDTGETGARTFVVPSQIAKNVQNQAHSYAADAQANDTYVITLTQVPAALAAGQRFSFKANTANTGAATLNVNSLGAITIKKFKDQDLETGDIEAGQIVDVEYDGTNFQMQSQIASQMSTAASAALTGGTSSNADAQHIHKYSKLLSFDLTNQTVTSGTETTLYTFSVPANTLGTSNAVKLEVYVTDFDAVNATNTVFNLKYGSTTIASCTIAGATGMTNLTGKIEGVVFANGNTAIQEGVLYVNLHDNGGLIGSIATAVGTGAEDSTGALNFFLTVDHPGSGSPSITTVNATWTIIQKA